MTAWNKPLRPQGLGRWGMALSLWRGSPGRGRLLTARGSPCRLLGSVGRLALPPPEPSACFRMQNDVKLPQNQRRK